MAQAKRTAKSKNPTAEEQDAAGLAALGLIFNDTVRFRRKEGGRWTEARVAGLNQDGSLHLFERRGAFRAIYAQFCEVKRKGPRGGTLWEPVERRQNA